jgi:putative ABC transport system permease protein
MNFLAHFAHAFEGIGIAFDSIRANKVRATLTIMGVAIGVFVVVALASVVRGVNEAFARDIEAAGPNSFFVYRRSLSPGPRPENSPERRNPGIRISEAMGMEQLPAIHSVTTHAAGSATFKYRTQEVNAGIEYYTANWTNVDGGDIQPGRSFTSLEYATAAPVVIINDRLAEGLFGKADPIGKEILVGGLKVRVIGLYHYTASPMGTPTSAGGGDSPKAIMPLETGRRRMQVGMRAINLIVKPRDGVSVDRAVDDVTAYLRTRRGLKPSQPDNFAVVTQDRLMAIYDQLFGTFFIVGFALSSVGLLVGGVGVIAIMMISVTERTREIGVRKALGATRFNILWQFLVEAVTLTGIGAGAGLVLGVIATVAVRSIWPSIPASTPLSSVVAALSVSAFTGVLFGILPAMRAARLDPVAALRHE